MNKPGWVHPSSKHMLLVGSEGHINQKQKKETIQTQSILFSAVYHEIREGTTYDP
jgi:hypothetical protein